MAESYERDGSGGAAFVCGLLTGVTVGAAAAMLFAPKPGRDMRRDLADGATDLGQAAKDRWRDVTEAASTAVDKGRETYHQAVGSAEQVADSAGQSLDNARDAVKEVASSAADSSGVSTSLPKATGGNR
jgi:gas vesicle protein